MYRVSGRSLQRPVMVSFLEGYVLLSQDRTNRDAGSAGTMAIRTLVSVIGFGRTLSFDWTPFRVLRATR